MRTAPPSRLMLRFSSKCQGVQFGDVTIIFNVLAFWFWVALFTVDNTECIHRIPVGLWGRQRMSDSAASTTADFCTAQALLRFYKSDPKRRQGPRSNKDRVVGRSGAELPAWHMFGTAAPDAQADAPLCGSAFSGRQQPSLAGPACLSSWIPATGENGKAHCTIF